MDEGQFKKQMDYIVQCIGVTENNPYAQLTGYIETGNDIYITRTGNARNLIKELDKVQIKRYLREMKRRLEDEI